MATHNAGGTARRAGIVLSACFAAQLLAGETPDRSAVIGRPFKISKSIREYCETAPPPMMCAQAMPLLAAMSSERRDITWAPRMEALIQKSMLVDGKPWIEIRALECRSTRCGLEYAVKVDDLGRDVDGSAELDRLLEPVGGIVAPELGPGLKGGRLVSVIFWTKLP
jgi:hypothetical protein